ncbi:putative ribonuclease H-like domain-containing protein [Tanacetum coccineum]
MCIISQTSTGASELIIAKEWLVYMKPNVRLKRQEKEANDAGDVFSANSTNTVNTVSTPISTAIPSNVFIVLGGHDSLTTIAKILNCKKISQALEDESWVDAMQEELLQFKIQKVWILVDLPFRKRAIRIKWVYRNKKNERDPKFPKKVYKVVKALYGLHQAPKDWYATLSTFLLKSGYRRGTIDKTLFIKKDKNDIMLVQVYVDDIIFGSTKKSWCDDFEALIKSIFQMKILKKFDFASVKIASTLIETQKPLTKDEEAVDVDVHLYRSMIGSLMYLTASRPDIMFAVCACSRFQVTPKTSHLHAVKRIFRYLKGKPKLGLWYPRVSSFDLEAYSDSDYARANLDRKSTTGEAEYAIAANCCGQVLWIQNQITTKWKTTKISQSSGSTNLVADKTVHKELGDRMERAATTASSFEVEQDSATARTRANGEVELSATIDGQVKTLTKASLRRHLKLEDNGGVTTLPNSEIFEHLALMGYATDSEKLTFQKGHFSPQWRFLIHTILHCLSPKKTSWEQFSSNIATAIICLATNRVYNFSKMIFDAMVKNVDSTHKFLMYPRFIQLCLNKQRRLLQPHTRTYAAHSLTNKVFNNMKRVTRGYTRVDTALFPTMLVQGQTLEGVESTAAPSTSQPPSTTPITTPETHQSPHSSPTMPTSHEAEEPATMPHDSPLPRVHTLGSDEGSMTLSELTVLCTNLSTKVTSLETELAQTKQTYGSALTKLIKKVKKLEQTVKSTQGKRRARLVISDDEEGQGDPSNQGRSLIEELDLDAEISLVPPHDTEIPEKTSGDTEILLHKEEPTELVEDFSSGEKGNEVSTATPERQVYTRRSAERIKGRQSCKKKNLDAEIAKQLQEDIHRASQEQEKQRVVTEADPTKVIDWSDPSVIRYHALQNRPRSVAEVRKNMCKYLCNQGGYKMRNFKGMTYDDIRLIFEKVWDQIHEFVPMDSELVIPKSKGAESVKKSSTKEEKKKDDSSKPAEGKRKKTLARKTASGKDKEEGLNVESLATKQDVLELYKLVKERFQTASPEGYDLLLWGDLKTMLEPDEEDDIWRNQQDWNLIN